MWRSVARSSTRFRIVKIFLGSELDDRADAFSFVHQVERFIDSLERQRVGDHGIDLDFAGQISFDVTGKLRTSFDTAKRRAAPNSSGDKLKRPRADLFSGCGDADDDRLSPPLVATLERRPHGFDVADTFERVIHPAIGQLYDLVSNWPARSRRVNELGRREP